MADYQVVGPLAIVKGEDGKVRYLYTGSLIPSDIDDEQRDRLVSDGLVAKVDDGQTIDPSAQALAVPTQPVTTVDRPRNTAPKDEWVIYAVSKGMSRPRAESMEKRDLIDALAAG